MIKKTFKNILRSFGYEIHKIGYSPKENVQISRPQPPPINPIWPLPRHAGGLSDEEIKQEFANHDLWHYAFEFDGNLSFSARHNNPGLYADEPERPLQRFRHFMPYLVAAHGGSLEGKRVLDIACNSGFWSIQCALLGANVVGFDARSELIDQANLIKSIVGVENVEFKTLDFWEMTPQLLGGTFDIVLCLGILYHLPKPLEALQLITQLAKTNILLDTAVFQSDAPFIKLHWEEPFDIRAASSSGIVASSSKSSIELMLRHIGVDEWFEIPIRSTDMPRIYLDGRRASWLIKVGDRVSFKDNLPIT